MRFLNWIDKKFTYREQKRYLISFLCFGVPFGYIFAQTIGIFVKGWSEYHFSIWNLFFTIIFDLLLVSPLIINCIKPKVRYMR